MACGGRKRVRCPNLSPELKTMHRALVAFAGRGCLRRAAAIIHVMIPLLFVFLTCDSDSDSDSDSGSNSDPVRPCSRQDGRKRHRILPSYPSQQSRGAGDSSACTAPASAMASGQDCQWPDSESGPVRPHSRA